MALLHSVVAGDYGIWKIFVSVIVENLEEHSEILISFKL